jgi:hypothetical protein
VADRVARVGAGLAEAAEALVVSGAVPRVGVEPEEAGSNWNCRLSIDD